MPVVWFDPPTSHRLVAGTEVVVTGEVSRRFFRAGGATSSRTEVVAGSVVSATQKKRAARAVEAAVAGLAEWA